VAALWRAGFISIAQAAGSQVRSRPARSPSPNPRTGRARDRRRPPLAAGRSVATSVRFYGVLGDDLFGDTKI